MSIKVVFWSPEHLANAGETTVQGSCELYSTLVAIEAETGYSFSSFVTLNSQSQVDEIVTMVINECNHDIHYEIVETLPEQPKEQDFVNLLRSGHQYLEYEKNFNLYNECALYSNRDEVTNLKEWIKVVEAYNKLSVHMPDNAIDGAFVFSIATYD